MNNNNNRERLIDCINYLTIESEDYMKKQKLLKENKNNLTKDHSYKKYNDENILGIDSKDIKNVDWGESIYKKLSKNYINYRDTIGKQNKLINEILNEIEYIKESEIVESKGYKTLKSILYKYVLNNKEYKDKDNIDHYIKWLCDNGYMSPQEADDYIINKKHLNRREE